MPRTIFQRLVLRQKRRYRCVDCLSSFLDWPTGEAEMYYTPRRKQAS